eukprot:931615_1
MPEEHILSYDQCTSLVQEDLVSISSQFDLSGRITILFKWPLEMPRLNRDRIDQNQQSLTALNWCRVFSPDSISFKCNRVSCTPEHPSATEPPGQTERNTRRDNQLNTISGITRTTNALLSVDGFISDISGVHAPPSISVLVL